MADRLTASEIFARTLRQPTAKLSESEAADRLQDLKDRGAIYLGGGEHTPIAGPAFREFRKDWQRMMVREGTIFDSGE